MELAFEKAYPLGFGLLAGVAALKLMPDQLLLNMQTRLLGDMISFAAILVGFLATAQAILASVTSSENIRRFDSLGGWELLMGYFGWGITAGFIVVSLSALLRMFSWDKATYGLRIGMSIWTVAAIWSILAAWRVVHIFTKLLKGLTRKE